MIQFDDLFTRFCFRGTSFKVWPDIPWFATFCRCETSHCAHACIFYNWCITCLNCNSNHIILLFIVIEGMKVFYPLLIFFCFYLIQVKDRHNGNLLTECVSFTLSSFISSIGFINDSLCFLVAGDTALASPFDKYVKRYES